MSYEFASRAVDAWFARCDARPRRRTIRHPAFELLEARSMLAAGLEPFMNQASPDTLGDWNRFDSFVGTPDVANVYSQAVRSAQGAAPDEGVWRSVQFNGGVHGTLGFRFTRDVPTVDPEGNLIAEDTRRFSKARTIVESNQWSVAISGSDATEILGSGWDNDGLTPLAAVFNKTDGELVFYREDGLFTRSTVSLMQQGHLDLLNGAVAGFRFKPRAGIVYEGLVVIQSQRDRLEDGSWIPEGISFVTTQDYGATMSRVPHAGGGFDVPGIAGGVADGIDRGESWAFANAFPEKSLDDVLGVCFRGPIT